MKISIKNVFKNILVFFVIFTLISGIAVLSIYEQSNSFKKISILDEQKKIINILKQIDKKDVELALIQYNGKSTELQYQINKLYELYQYDISGNYILNNSNEYKNDLQVLSNLIDEFNAKAYSYYKSSEKNRIKRELSFEIAYNNLEKQINLIIFKNIDYDKQKLQYIIQIALGIFIFVILVSIWYASRLKKIYNDISYLQSPSKSENDYIISTKEADAILIRMRKKPEVKENQTNIDPITNINNNKGLVNEYAEKKNFKESNFTSVTILEVDNFSKTKRAFNQEFSQAALKKIAYTISLFEQAADVIARTDYNQFTIILSRDSKVKAFKDMEAIREAIAELKFVTQTKVPVQITVSGGFYIKPNNVVLNNAIAEAKKILLHAKESGSNTISQKKDVDGVNI